MGSSKQRKRKSSNPDLRRQTQIAAPPISEIEKLLLSWLSPEMFTPLKFIQGKNEKMLRERLLNLPVMMAIILSLVYRRIAGLSEVVRILASEGLLGQEKISVTKQALSKRLMTMPAELFADIFEKVIEKIRRNSANQMTNLNYSNSLRNFAAVWIADGSTLEQLRCKLKALKDNTGNLGGRMMMIVSAINHNPISCWYTEDNNSNDKIFADKILNKLPVNGLLIFDLGFFSFKWFDGFTEKQKFFITRLREKTAYKKIRSLSVGVYYQDEIIKMGLHHHYPCNHNVRLVSVLWGTQWYYYLTNVLDPNVLSAQEVCELYRRRWKIEEAFLITKRLLGLAYIWVGNANGVQIQILATWIFYAVLNQLCSEIAAALNQPKDKISVEMVFRGLYHYSRASLREETDNIISFFVEHHKLLGLIKVQKRRDKEKHSQSELIWASAPLS